MNTPNRDVRLSFRLPAEFKSTIEEAAAELGQTVSDFAISTLVQTARRVLQSRDVTMLSDRDREAFIAVLDDKSAKPNRALRDAVKRYRRDVEEE